MAALGLILAFWLATAQAQEPLVVQGDWGGSVAARALHIARLGDRPVRIEGFCASACTMYLGARDVCVTPDAELAFHGPQIGGVLPLGPRDFERVSRFIAGFYPDTLADWYLETGRHSQALQSISGADVIRNGWARACD